MALRGADVFDRFALSFVQRLVLFGCRYSIMAKSKAAAKREKMTPRAASPLDRKWALVIAFLVSVLLHALLGVEVSRLLRTQTVQIPSSPGDPVTVRLVPASPKAPLPDTQGTAPKVVKKPTPRPTPPPEQLQEAPKPAPVEKVKKIIPPRPRPSRRETPVIPSALPEKRAAPGQGNPRKDRKPAPLPRGSQDGSRRAPSVTKAEPRIAPRLDAPPTLLRNVPDTEAVQPANPSTAVVKVEKDVPTAPAANPVPPAPAEGAGNGRGAGKTDDLRINRGIPFGDAMGIPKGGDANGGGGIGRGPGGSAGTGRGLGASIGYVKKAPLFTLARPARSDDGPPIHIVYVIDVSGSMEENGKIGRVRAAMEKALTELRSEDYFNIVLFSDKATLFSKTMRPATAFNVSAGISSVDVALPSGQTNLSAALELAFQQPDVTHIFVMSDGEPTEGITDFSRIALLARQENNGAARILTLALGRGERFKGMELLRQLAEEGRGKFNYIDLSKR